jgi:uncharacterized membrane-anchored protein YitT (DUF2179 family)
MARAYASPRLLSRAWCAEYAQVVAGALLVAGGFHLFMIPHDIVPGGVVGAAQLVNHLTGWPVGVVSLAFNLPILLLATRLMGPYFGLKTLLSMIVIAVAVDLLAHLRGTEPLVQDIVVSVVFGGVAIGSGIALVLRGRANAGGTPLVGQLLARMLRIPVGRAMFYVDACVVGGALVVFRNPDLVAYALIAIFAISRTVNAALQGLEATKALLVISDHHEAIREELLSGLERGGTYLAGRGLFQPDQERRIILTALSVRESVVLQRRIRDLDPQAFCMVFDASQVIGEGFRPWH